MNIYASTKVVAVLGRGEEKLSLSEAVSFYNYSKCDRPVKGRVRILVMYF